MLMEGDRMAISAFYDKSIMPDNDMVSVALADTYVLWNSLQNHIKKEYPNVVDE